MDQLWILLCSYGSALDSAICQQAIQVYFQFRFSAAVEELSQGKLKASVISHASILAFSIAELRNFKNFIGPNKIIPRPHLGGHASCIRAGLTLTFPIVRGWKLSPIPLCMLSFSAAAGGLYIMGVSVQKKED